MTCFTLNWPGIHAFHIRLELCWQFPNITEYHQLEWYRKTGSNLSKIRYLWVHFRKLRSRYIYILIIDWYNSFRTSNRYWLFFNQTAKLIKMEYGFISPISLIYGNTTLVSRTVEHMEKEHSAKCSEKVIVLYYIFFFFFLVLHYIHCNK